MLLVTDDPSIWVMYNKYGRREVARYEKLCAHISKYKLTLCTIREGDLVQLEDKTIRLVEKFVPEATHNPFWLKPSGYVPAHTLKLVYTV